MITDLVERLRLNDREIYLPILGEAADRIATLEEACNTQAEWYADDLAKHKDRITALIAAGDKLAGFAEHDERCWEPLNPCNCGYTDAWKKWQEVRGND